MVMNETGSEARSTGHRRNPVVTLAVLQVDWLPDHCHLEGACNEYGDAVGIRAVDETTGRTSNWRILRLRNGRAEVRWNDLWDSGPATKADSAA